MSDGREADAACRQAAALQQDNVGPALVAVPRWSGGVMSDGREADAACRSSFAKATADEEAAALQRDGMSGVTSRTYSPVGSVSARIIARCSHSG